MRKHAFLIMAHHNVNQLKRLIKYLDHENIDLYVHIDKKSKIDINQISKITAYSTVKFIQRFDIAWGGNSQVKCEVALLSATIQGDYSYYHLISGDDLPLVSLETMLKFFEMYTGYEFISINKEATESQSFLYRLKYYYPFQNLIKSSKIISHLLKKAQDMIVLVQKLTHVNRLKDSEIVFGKGSNWFSITHDFAIFVIAFYRNCLYKYFAYTIGCDELLVQTCLLNSQKYKKNVYEEGNMRYIDWSRSIDGCSPTIFTYSDYDMIMSSGKLWARKFSENVDDKIVNRIYETIEQDNNFKASIG